MTRNKQIWDADNHYRELGSRFNNFENGAKWADAHPAWIDVNEELPPKVTNDGKVSINVLVCCKGEYGHEMYILDCYDYEANNWVTADNSLVTHWMKIIPPQNKI